MRRAPWIAAIASAAVSLPLVGAGLVYIVASGAPRVPTQPTTPAEAEEAVRALGLAAEYPFDHYFFEATQGRLHYVDEGQGAPVLCVHGNPTWSFLYREVVKRLSAEARVVAPDLVGFGLSEKPPDPASYSIEGHIADLSALVDALDLRDITLVIHDWGGPIGMGVALEHPGRVRAIVAMNTIAFVPESARRGEDGTPPALEMLRLPILGELLVQGVGVFGRFLIPLVMGEPERWSEAARTAYRDVHGNWPARAGVLAFPRLIPTRPEDPVVALLERAERYLRSFEGEVLLIWGLADPLFDRESLDEWRRRVPHARVVEIPEAGHYLQEEAPERIVPPLRALLHPERSVEPR